MATIPVEEPTTATQVTFEQARKDLEIAIAQVHLLDNGVSIKRDALDILRAALKELEEKVLGPDVASKLSYDVLKAVSFVVKSGHQVA